MKHILLMQVVTKFNLWVCRLRFKVKSINFHTDLDLLGHVKNLWIIFCNTQVHTLVVQSNPSIADTTGTNKFVLYSEVSLIQWLPVFSSSHGMRNVAVEHNMHATLSELSLGVYTGKEG